MSDQEKRMFLIGLGTGVLAMIIVISIMDIIFKP
jgi:hypothetical protein